VTVSNTGPLVAPGEVSRLFQPFQRQGAQRLRQAGGHGLGLAIVSAIAAVHGAGIEAGAPPPAPPPGPKAGWSSPSASPDTRRVLAARHSSAIRRSSGPPGR
jgi:hypothetical protein